jgi:hypothetical protein
MIYNGFGCRHRPSVSEDLSHPISLYPILGMDRHQNVAAFHFVFVLPRLILPHPHANQRAR